MHFQLLLAMIDICTHLIQSVRGVWHAKLPFVREIQDAYSVSIIVLHRLWRARMLGVQVQAPGWKNDRPLPLKMQYALRIGCSHSVVVLECSVDWSWHNFGDRSRWSDTQILNCFSCKTLSRCLKKWQSVVENSGK